MADKDHPSQFIVEWAAAMASAGRPPGRALDIAMGRGRHALVLAEHGFRVFGVDVNLNAVRDAVAQASAHGLVVRGWCADLTEFPLPRERFELVVVSRYLQRDLFPSLRDALTPGGVVLFETFTEAQRGRGRGPTSADHLLALGELRARFDAFEVLFYEEVVEPEAVARIVAKRSS